MNSLTIPPAATTTLAERLVQARTNRGLKQDESAAAVGMTQQSYSDLERGVVKRSTYIGSLARLFGVNAYWLETGKGHADDTIELTDDERFLIDTYRQMEPVGRKGFLAFLGYGKPK